MARQKVLCTLAACAACVLIPAAAASAACSGSDSAPSAATLSQAKSATLCLINQARTRRGLSSLDNASSLARAAAAHSRDMVSRDFFSHTSPAGSTMQQRIDRAGYMDGASRWSVGETIAWGAGSQATPGSIVRSWLKSPPHRAILLQARFDDVGIGIALGAPEGGDGATFTGDFGARG